MFVRRVIALLVYVAVGFFYNSRGEVSAQDAQLPLAAGATHSCVINSDSEVKCWGDAAYGQIGYGDSTSRLQPPNIPVTVSTRNRAVQVVAGDFHTCVLLDNGKIKCWGRGKNGRLGYGDENNLFKPSSSAIRLGWRRTVAGITAGGSHTCALLDNSVVRCWGLNQSGQLGYGDRKDRQSALSASIDMQTVNQSITQIAAGGTHTCALFDNGGVKCWGEGMGGQLGYGNTTTLLAPHVDFVHLGRNRFATQIAVGASHTCALLIGNEVKCWGANSQGQLGYGDRTARTAPPAAVIDLQDQRDRPVERLVAGRAYTCVVFSGAKAKCWGSGSAGQLGYGDQEGRLAPPLRTIAFASSGGGGLSHLAVGESHTCALFADDSVRCWGANNHGQLGYNDLETRLQPPAAPINLGRQ